MNNWVLIAMVGLPRSGKTTWAREQRMPTVCPDCIRLALHGNRYVVSAEAFVWAIAKVMVHSLFLSGVDKVILDATNNTFERREEWSKEGELRGYNVFFKLIDTPKDVCLKRALAEGDNTIVNVIDSMAIKGNFVIPEDRRWI